MDQHKRSGTAGRVIATALLLIYFIFLCALVFLPSEGHQVIGLVWKLSVFATEFGVSLSQAFTVLEFSANIALFMPLGFLLPWLYRRCRKSRGLLTILAGVLISVAIETTQIFLPDRVASIYDVLANGLGTVIGVVIHKIFHRCAIL